MPYPIGTLNTLHARWSFGGASMVVAVLLVVGACKKTSSSAENAKISGVGSVIELKLPSAPPPKTKDNLGADIGANLAKLPTLSAPAPAPTAPVTVDTIPKTPQVAGAGFRVSYVPSADETSDQIRQLFAGLKTFEQLADAINSEFRIPIPVDIVMSDCGAANAFYDPKGKRLIVCYELITYFATLYKPAVENDDQLGVAVVSATLFAFLHELGHALIDILDLPAVGREEDAADQVATLVMLGDQDTGAQLLLTSAYWFQMQSQSGAEAPFWDEHAFGGQRFYNILCMLYGSAPDKYGELVANGSLPQDRADRCPDEYAKIDRAWTTMLSPHAKNPGTATPTTPRAPTLPAIPPTTPKAKPTACQIAAAHITDLIGTLIDEQGSNATPEELAAARGELKKMPATLQRECETEHWTAANLTCAMAAKTLAEAKLCD